MKTTLSSPSPIANERQISSDKSNSPSSSPRSSPRPSPRAQTKKDHSKSEYLSVSSNKEQSQSLKHESSPSSQEGSSDGRVANIEITPPQDTKSEAGSYCKDKRDGRTKKKSSWFNSFYPTYKSRSEELKKLFKDVPDDERLVVDYSCALQKEILIHGRLYVTQNYLCFYSKIITWETNVTLRWKDVAAITKEKTALVIPNAILICTKLEKYFFTSFVARDKTYLMLFRVWQNALMDQPMTAPLMWQWVHQCYGDELGLTSEDEDYIPPNQEEDKLSARLSLESFSENESGCPKLTIDEFNMEERQEDDTSNLNAPSLTRNASDSQIPTDYTDNSESDGERGSNTKLLKPTTLNIPRKSSSFSFFSSRTHEYDATGQSPDSQKSDDNQNIKCSANHDGKKLLSEVIPIHIDQLFTLLFTSSKFYLDFHASRKTTDLTQTPWTHNPVDNCKSRVVNLTLALSQTVGPKSAQVTETQVMLPCSKAGHLYAIDVETINAGVPYADSFCVLVHYCLQKVSDTHSSIEVFAQIKYKKNVWSFVKGMIERNCWSGLEDFFGKLKEALFAEGEDNIPELKRKSKRKRRLHSLPKLICAEDSRISVPRKKVYHSSSFFSTDVCTIIVFLVLIALLVLNVLLYFRLWSLEQIPAYNLLNVQSLKNPPQSHDEWLKLLQHQEALHSIEAQKWQQVLKTAIKLLRQTEESLNELQGSIHPTYMSKVMSMLKDQQDVPPERPKDEL